MIVFYRIKMTANRAQKGPVSRPLKLTRNVTVFLCLIGLCISVFALYIEILKELNPEYVPLCDVNSYIACSRALTSRYGKGFGIVDKIFSNTSILNQPNTVYGMAFYTFQATLALNPSSSTAVVQVFFNIVANVASIYLGYILYFIIRDLCMVCISTYIVNFLLLVTSLIKLKNAALADINQGVRKKK